LEPAEQVTWQGWWNRQDLRARLLVRFAHKTAGMWTDSLRSATKIVCAKLAPTTTLPVERAGVAQPDPRIGTKQNPSRKVRALH